MIKFYIGTGQQFINKSINDDDRIYCFEPVDELASMLANQNSKNLYTVPKAVSDYDGVSKFYLAGLNNYNLSSLSKFSDNSTNSWPGRNDFIVTKEIKIPVIRLDTFISGLEEKIENIDYIHIDANGSDLNVLRGLGGYINLIKSGEMIASIIPEAIYVNQNTLLDSISFLKNNNFVISSVEPIDQYGNQAKIYFTKII